MTLDWLGLRPHNGDVKNAFEELVCQLARAEKIANRAKFLRIAAPDGGVESYCVLSNGDEYGWQAKFFTAMESSQWKQLDESFKTAFGKHPNLKKYYICIPLDRQDPRIENQKWFMDKWNDRVAEWQLYSRGKGREVEFEYWGSSELFDRLSRTENEGKFYYWFNREELTFAWFQARLETAIKNLDKRYTPEVNFTLPSARIFEGLARDAYFKEQFDRHLDDFLKNANKALDHADTSKFGELIQKIRDATLLLQKSYLIIDFSEVGIIDQDRLCSILTRCIHYVDELIDAFYENAYLNKEKKDGYDEHGSGGTRDYSWDIEYFRRLKSSIRTFISFIKGVTVTVSNNPFLLLVGEAGIGKSHMLADLALKRLERGQLTILLLGQHFNLDEPWSQIAKQLQLNCSRDAFLSALNTKAEASGSRILICIDALNEGEGKRIWKNHIAGFIVSIKKYPWIGLVVSVRTSYEKLVIPESLIENNELIRVVHSGFANHEYDASKLFFENYHIKQPAIPLLHPEFSNPLFLKLFCEGLEKKKMSEFPTGYEGITSIIHFYLDAINIRMAEKYNYHQKLRLVQKIIPKVAGKIIEAKSSYLNFEEAFVFISNLPEVGLIADKPQFFQDLISEGLFTENIIWDKDEYTDGLFFSYERFGDHMMAAYFIESSIADNNDVANLFQENSNAYELLKDEKQAYLNKGVIEALSVQIPEKFGFELFELVGNAKNFEVVASAFLESIIWRRKETIHSKVLDYINSVVIGLYDFDNDFIEKTLLVTSIEKHFFNSDFLHSHLLDYSLADRDAWWLPIIHNTYPGDGKSFSAVKRILDWAWNEEDKSHISDESVRLMSQTISWFLSSTNRKLRDSSTKALICLLENRINVLLNLLESFESINDPYIYQRIYAVAYGCAIRTEQIDLLKELADYVYKTVFEKEFVYPDILLRDYAREIVEYASHIGIVFDFDITLIRPPYKSELPSDFPSNEEIDVYRLTPNTEGFKDYYRSQNRILASMVTEYGRGTGGYGDFGRYVFESGFKHWKHADVNGLSNLAVKWIFEKYSYDVKKHGEFDRQIKFLNVDRHYVENESIGKKYQWIAFHELLARVADNYKFYESFWGEEEPTKYEGPWEPYIRDIDPSFVIKKTNKNNLRNYWWIKENYSNWSLSNKEWVFKTDDLPILNNLIDVIDQNGTEWLVLQMFPNWSEPADIGKDKWESPHKELWYHIRSYMTDVVDYNTIVNWARSENLMRESLPHSTTIYEVFSREFYWAPPNETIRKRHKHDYGKVDWQDVYDSTTGQLIGKVAVTAVDYSWGEQYDASKESTVAFYKPTELIFKGMNLRYAKVEGELLSSNGEVICFDPSVMHPTLSCLLVKKHELLRMLTNEKLNIFWTVIGEKQIIGGTYRKGNYEGRLVISGTVYFEQNELVNQVNYYPE